jgi:hypothetical protein
MSWVAPIRSGQSVPAALLAKGLPVVGRQLVDEGETALEAALRRCLRPKRQ